MGSKAKCLVGLRFGRLTVIGGRTSDAKGNASWDCLCDCGKKIRTRMSSLQNGQTKSCGCLRSEEAIKKGLASKTHGLSRNDLYNAWNNMIDRCQNSDHYAYKDYGERGITVCSEWLQVENFISDMSPRPSGKHQLDRKDNSKGYSKENCRWVTSKINMRNTRANVYVELNGQQVTLAEAAELTGKKYTTLHYRHSVTGLTQETGLFSKVHTL